MTDQQQAQDAHVSDADDAQDATSQDDSQASAQDATPTGFDALPKETQEEIRALRRENAKHRKALKEYEDAQKSELERYQSQAEEYKSELDTLRQQMRDNAAESAFLDAAAKANARAPRTLFRAYKSDLAFDDDGTVTNLDAVIAKAQEDEPDLFRSSTGRADNGQKGEAPTDDMNMNDVLRGMAKQAPR